MSKTKNPVRKFLGYVPSLKEKHEATIVEGKAIVSKGGSIRYTLRGEYNGRKTLPKTVTKADFEGIYGFDAKAAEAVIIRGYDKDGKFGNKGHEVGITEKDGFTPDEVLKTGGLMRPLDDLLNHADTVGSPSPASVEPSAPSEKPFPQEPSNENFSAEHTDASELLREEEEAWVKQYDEYMEHPMEDIEASYLQGDMVLWTPTLEEFKKGIHEDRGIDHEVYLKFVQDLKDGKMDLITGGTFYEVKEAFGFGKDEEPEEEKPKEQEFTVVLQEGDKLELTDIEEDVPEEMEPKEEDSPEESENEEKEAESNDNKEYHISTYLQEEIDGEKNGWANWYLDGTGIEKDLDWEVCETKKTYEEAVDYIKKENEETPLAYAAIWEWDFDAYGGDGDYTKNYEIIIWTDPEVYEDLQNYFIEQEIMWANADDIRQIIVDLELDKTYPNTNIILNDEGSMKAFIRALNKKERVHDYNYSFSAESNVRVFVVSSVDYETDGQDLDLRQDFTFALDKDDIGDTTDMQEIADEIIDDISDETGFLVNGFYFQEKMPDGTMVSLDAESYQAVQAKVTRPVKEEEDEEEEKEEEGMSTLMKVGLGVGALAVGAAILGAEDEGESDYWAGENAHWRAEEFEASRHHGGDKKKKLMKDNYENKWKKNLNDRFNKKTIADEDLRYLKKHGQAENFSAESKLHPGLYRYKGKIGMRKGWTECQECDDIVKQKDVNWYYIKGYGQATICDSCVGKYNYKKDRLSKGGRHGELAILQFMEQDRKGAENLSREGTYNIDIESYIDNEDELEEKGYSQRDIEAMKQEVENKYKDGDEVFEDLKTNELDIALDGRLENDDEEVYLKYGDKMVGGVESGIDYVGDFGGFNAEETGSEPSNENFEATTGYGYDDPPERMTDEEAWLEMYDDYLEDEDSPMTLEEYKKWVIEAREEDYQMQVKYEQRLKDEGRDMDGNPIKEAECGGCGSVYEDEDVYTTCDLCGKDSCDNCGDSQGPCHQCGVMFCYACSGCGDCGYVCENCECDCNSKEAESKNLKMALGITAVGIALAAILGKDKLTKLFDRFNL